MTESKPGNLVFKPMYLTTMVYLAWTDLVIDKVKKEVICMYAIICHNFSKKKKHQNSFFHHTKL